MEDGEWGFQGVLGTYPGFSSISSNTRSPLCSQLSGTSGSRQGSLITYSLFLKTPLQGNGHYITIPQKKIFTPRNLKMALFNNNVC